MVRDSQYVNNGATADGSDKKNTIIIQNIINTQSVRYHKHSLSN